MLLESPLLIGEFAEVAVTEPQVNDLVGSLVRAPDGTLSRLLDRLEDSVFVRANRTQAVNMDHVTKIADSDDGNLLLHLDDKLVVEASRRNSAEFRQSRAIL